MDFRIYERFSLNRETCLVVMVKYPDSEKVKTRLGREIGMDKAGRLYKDFVSRLLTTCSEISCPAVISLSLRASLRAQQSHNNWLRLLRLPGNNIEK